jgi:hypothetical protein
VARVSPRKPRGNGRPDAGPKGAPSGAPAGPRRPNAPASAGAAAPGRGENRPSPSLVIASFLGRETVRRGPGSGEGAGSPVRVGYIEYPDGGGELFGVASGTSGRRKSSGSNLAEWRQRVRDERECGHERADELAAERRLPHEERSAAECARRAKSRVRRLCRSYGLDHMVTLTFPGHGVHEYNYALRLVQDFVHDHGEAIHRGRGKWLAVPELHPGGHGWHWHVLVDGRFSKTELEKLRVEWTEFLRRREMRPSGGATYVRIDVKGFKNASTAASYAAKYVAKGFGGDDRQKGRKRFLRPQGLDVAVQRGWASALDEVREAIEQIGPDVVFESGGTEDWRGPPMVWAAW